MKRKGGAEVFFGSREAAKTRSREDAKPRSREAANWDAGCVGARARARARVGAREQG